jgi:hypothetical protein
VFCLVFDREFNFYLRFRGVNKQLNRRLPRQGSPPHPPAPSPRSGARGRKRDGITHLLILLPSPRTRGEGLGVRGFALCFGWFFDREFNFYLRFRRVNK